MSVDCPVETMAKGCGCTPGPPCRPRVVSLVGFFYSRCLNRHVGNFCCIQPAVGMRKVAFSGPLRGIAVGEEGVILHTRNGGQSWRASNPKCTLGTLHDVLIDESSLHVFAVADNGVLCRSEDDVTWAPSKISVQTMYSLSEWGASSSLVGRCALKQVGAVASGVGIVNSVAVTTSQHELKI